MDYDNLKKQDKKIMVAVSKEMKRQNEELELIASENYVSEAVLEAMATVLANKYSEGYAGARYYGGNQNIDEVEKIAVSRVKKLFNAEYANVQPLSGSPANAAVYFAFLKPGDKVMGLRLDHGGHLSHGHPINFSGMLYDFVQYEVDKETGKVDMEKVRELALKEKPKMIVAGYSAYSREVDWRGFKKIADEVSAYTFADISHTAGLIASGLLDNPTTFFDVVATTTHKTLRGPRGAIIMCKEKYAKQIDRAVFPGLQGGPHDHITAAKAVALKEADRKSFQDYSRQVIANAKKMSDLFKEKGYKVVSGETDNHLMILDLTSSSVKGGDIEKSLEKAGISVSRSTIPGDPNPPKNPSGIRLGSPAITTRGMVENEVEYIVDWIDTVIKNSDNEKELANIRGEVKKMCLNFPIPGV